MATLTAQVLIGTSHPNHGGILPTHALMVSENSRAALVLVPFMPHGERPSAADENTPPRIVWIPHPEHIVDDIILLVCIHVLHEGDVIAKADSIMSGLSTADHVDLGDLSPADRAVLSTACRELTSFPKLVVTLLEGSFLRRDIARFGEYTMDIEICTPTYVREYSDWTAATRTAGDLGALQGF